MTAPIQSGDRCEVIGGLGRAKSPNIGLTVRVVSFQGEHTQLGRIWRCEGPGVQQLTDAGTYTVTGVADFAAAWLRKIEPDQTTDKTNTANEVTA
jgi:hypothetical protein